MLYFIIDIKLKWDTMQHNWEKILPKFKLAITIDVFKTFKKRGLLNLELDL